MSRDRAFRVTVSIVGSIGLVAGIRLLEGGPIGASVPAAFAGAASQLAATALATLAVLSATSLNVAMGAAAARMVLNRPFDSLGSMILTGLAVAVLIDTAALMLLGGIGVFLWPSIMALHAIVLGLAWRRFRRLPALALPAWSGAAALTYLLPGLVWGAAIVLQVASPVVPFMDVLFNHVAPVEHVRIFGSFETLTTSPSPNFGPSRTLFGYVALQSTIAALVQLPAALTVAAFILPLTLLFALAVHRLADGLFGEGTGYWALITMPLSFVFLRIPDARATALVFPLVAWALTLLITPPAGTRRQRQVLVLAPLAAGLYVHPFIAGLMVLTVVVLIQSWPRRYARIGGPAVVAALLLAAPQAAATLGVAAPAWSGLLAIPLAAVGLWLTDRFVARFVRVGRAAAAVMAVAALLLVQDIVHYATDAMRDVAFPFPLLAIGALVGGLAFRRPGIGFRVVGAGVGVAILVMAVTRLLPAESSLVQSLQGEAQPKALAYWAPFLLALAAAAACHRAATLRSGIGVAHIAVALSVFVAILPLRLSPTTINLDNYEEHRMAESASIALHHAEHGYWRSYPDSRRIVNDSQTEFLERLVVDRATGLIGPRTHLLHAADSFRPWVGTPVAVFTGMYESTASHDPERSIHTEGGRLYGLDEFTGLLTGDYQYVLLEGEALVNEFADDVASAGFASILENEQGELFRLATLGAP